MTLFVQIVYVLITVVMILVVLLQAGRGGGLGTALGGGASQSVFGGSGGADFLAKLTQGLAIGFMICAVYLAYASSHTGSEFLQAESAKFAGEEVSNEGEINYEQIGQRPQPLPKPGDLPPRAAASAEPEQAPADPAEDETQLEAMPEEPAPQ